MAFISREELPITLRAAYDKAAKGVENDETRTSGENDKKKIDSEKELLMFRCEVEKLASEGLDKMTYDGIKTEICKVMKLIHDDKNYSKRTKEYNKLVDKRTNLEKQLSQALNDMSTLKRVITLNGTVFCKKTDEKILQYIGDKRRIFSAFNTI